MADLLNCHSCHYRLNPGDSVLLLCECLVSICQDCARNQLLRNELTYNSYIQCPACSHRVHSSDGIFLGIADAMSQEDAIVRQALADTGVIHTDTSSPRFIELQACLNRLVADVDPTAPKDVREAPSAPRKGGANRGLEVILADLRLRITNLAMTRFGIPLHPVETISFRRNRFLENFLVYRAVNPEATVGSFRASPEARQLRQCSVCVRYVTSGRSVLLLCQCNGMICRACAVKGAAVHKETHHGGITCPLCHLQGQGVVGNLPYLDDCEHEMIRSGQTYISDRLLVGQTDKRVVGNDRFHLQTLRNMLRMYWCLEYGGEIKEELLPSVTERQVRYEIARLEEMRLSRIELMPTYRYDDSESGIHRKLPLGFLADMDIRRNVFFEHLYIHIPDGKTHRAPRVAQSYLERIKIARTEQQNECLHPDLLHKLVLVAMYVHRDMSEPHKPLPFTLREDVCEAFKMYFASPMQKFSEGIGREFTNIVSRRITVAAMRAILRDLQDKGWVKEAVDKNGRSLETFALRAADVFMLRGRPFQHWKRVQVMAMDPGLLACAKKDFHIYIGTATTTAAGESVVSAATSPSASRSAPASPAAVLPAPPSSSAPSTKRAAAAATASSASRRTPTAPSARVAIPPPAHDHTADRDGVLGASQSSPASASSTNAFLLSASAPAAALAPITSATAAPRHALFRQPPAIAARTIAAVARSLTRDAPAPRLEEERAQIPAASSSSPPSESTKVVAAAQETIDLTEDSESAPATIPPGQKRALAESFASSSAGGCNKLETVDLPAAKKLREHVPEQRAGDSSMLCAPAAKIAAVKKMASAATGKATLEAVDPKTARLVAPMPRFDPAEIEISDSSYSDNSYSSGCGDGDGDGDGSSTNSSTSSRYSDDDGDGERLGDYDPTEHRHQCNHRIALSDRDSLQLEVRAMKAELVVVKKGLAKEKGKRNKAIQRVMEHFNELRDELERVKAAGLTGTRLLP